MDNLSKQIIAEMANVEEAIRNLEDAMSRQIKTVVELAAIATFLHNFYNGIENILKQSLGMKNIRINKSDKGASLVRKSNGRRFYVLHNIHT